MPGEFDFIHWIRTQASSSRPSVTTVPIPIGDDLAAVRWDAADLLLVGVDQVLDGRHFDLRVHRPYDVGSKAINRNLSDCAAMAALPAYALTTLALPRTATLETAKAIHTGITDAAARFGCTIIGGDTASWDGPLAVTVTILGRSAGVPPVRRAGARAGDYLYVTGPLGGSILGRHLTFLPRVSLARQLATSFTLTAMIDLSDGLSSDLRHLCEASGVGALVDANAVPIHPDVDRLPGCPGMSRLDHALHDGEDHELLLASPDDIPPALATRIGRITSDDAVRLARDGSIAPLPAKGWEHPLG
jgi:thiamine-monophosphate kinase